MGNKVVGVRADDKLFDRANECAKLLGISRNKLIVTVVAAYCDYLEKKNAAK